MDAKKIFRIVCLIDFIGIILCAASFFLTFQEIDIDIAKITIGDGVKNPPEKLNWFYGISIIFCGFLIVALAIYEVLLLINPTKFKFYNYSILRIIVHIYLGIASIGVAGDLGISAAAFLLLNAVVNLVIYLATFCECIKLPDPNNQGSYQNADKALA